LERRLPDLAMATKVPRWASLWLVAVFPASLNPTIRGAQRSTLEALHELLPRLQDWQHLFRKQLQASLRNMEGRAAEPEGHVPLEIAEQSATFFKPP
jgi:hypothetical protein